MPIGEGGELNEAVGRHDDAVRAVCEAGVNIALAGHFHRTYAAAARKMVEKAGAALVIQAGTATSRRLRNNELQSFNWIHAHRNNDIELQVIAWDGSGFRRGSHVRYAYDGDDWSSRTVEHEAPAEVAAAQLAHPPGTHESPLPLSRGEEIQATDPGAAAAAGKRSARRESTARRDI
jgi:hypothetical protein